MNSSIWPIDGTLTGTTTSGQSEPGSNDNERVHHNLKSSRTGTSPSCVSYTGHSLGLGLPLDRRAASIFYSPTRHGPKFMTGIELFIYKIAKTVIIKNIKLQHAN